MEYTIIGAAIIISCTTLFCAEVATGMKRKAETVNDVALYFSALAETLSHGSDLPDAIEQCSAGRSSESLYYLMVQSLRNADNASVKTAWNKCIADNRIETKKYTEAEYITQFASICGGGGDGYASAATYVSETAAKDSENLRKKAKADSKLLIYSGLCAGGAITMLLI